MPRKKKKSDNTVKYSKQDSFDNLETVQELALNRKGKDDELNPDISVFLKAEELKGKLCGLYSDKTEGKTTLNKMGAVKIDGTTIKPKVGEDVNNSE
ncbi:hypothetical protein IKQ26_09820 [bacterium]|nr:hypothetical protein [bacterium]